MEPGVSGGSVVTDHQHLNMADTATAMQQGRPAAMQQGAGQQQLQMQANASAGAQAAASPGKTQDAVGLQRLTAALTAVLSSGMASDFVEGLKPVLHNGKLAISTYIKLQQDPEPVFIGMFSSLPAAVAAQKQSAELVSVAERGVVVPPSRLACIHLICCKAWQAEMQSDCQHMRHDAG